MTTTPAHPKWAEPYRLAVFETNPAKLKARISKARSAISERTIELEQHSGNESEVRALSDALRILRLLEREAQSTKPPDEQ